MYDALGDLSLDLFRAFESAARQQSFTAAAIELGTTQPAISQQIKRLEEQLGTRLFDRIYRGIELTEAGAILFEQVQAGLQSIDAGLTAITAQHQHEVLQVATDFAFAAYWLMPRLHRFHAANPQVDVSLVTSERNHNMLRTDIDVAVLFGDGRFKQGESRWLFSEEVFPVCSPLLLGERTLPLPAHDLSEFPLLHLRGGNSSAWFDWSGVFRELGITSPPAPGQLRFDNYTLLIQARSAAKASRSAGGTLWITYWRRAYCVVRSPKQCSPGWDTTWSCPQRKRRGVLIKLFVDWLMEEQANSAESLTGLPLPSIAV